MRPIPLQQRGNVHLPEIIHPVPPLYGPPTDPREVQVLSGVSDLPLPWAACLLVGATLFTLGVVTTKRSKFVEDWADLLGSALVVGGVTALLTAPAGALSGQAVWGHFPTIDKAGSLHFYGLGAHFHAFAVGSESTQLIGISQGHLWVSQLLEWSAFGLISPFAAMNVQAFANLAGTAWAASRLFRELGAKPWPSLMAALPIGLGLHALRDVNWYTVEKSGLGWLIVWFWMLLRANERGAQWIFIAGAAYAWAFFYNSYWGVLGAVGAGLVLPFLARPGRVAVGVAAVLALPLVLAQLPALHNGMLPTAPAFAARAGLDVLGRFAWNRLELWRALDAASVLAAGVFVVRSPKRGVWLFAVCIPAILALGPQTPVWSAFALLPGMWRFSKPETFFHLSVIVIGAQAAFSFGRLSRRRQILVATLQAAAWLVLVRTHAVYPGFSRPG